MGCWAGLLGMRYATVSSETCRPLVGMSGPMSLTTAAAMVGVRPPAAPASAQLKTGGRRLSQQAVSRSRKTASWAIRGSVSAASLGINGARNAVDRGRDVSGLLLVRAVLARRAVPTTPERCRRR